MSEKIHSLADMKRMIVTFCALQLTMIAFAQSKTLLKEYKKTFTTYPYSDPNPIPDPSARYYPYFRYDGFTTVAQQKEWTVVELENDYIKVAILPGIGGKIWSAEDKKTGKDFIYNNHVIKFRDVAMRGPWTSGGIEANYGIIGHTPNCATPVDYTTVNNKDGSASCIIGVLDLLTQTQWRLEINLAPDKAYFTTKSFWYNASPLEQPYYTWMNTGIKAKGNLEFIYPGNHYLGHEGEYGDWPVNQKNGKNISFYEQNNFGGYKSYHVFGTYADFFGGYWHDDDRGMAHYSTHDDKPGKKIWIWGLSRQGMIWEKLLTDNDGQYVEVQSGRLFNQGVPASMLTPFKYRGFTPSETDTWTEYWFPVIQTKGFVKANEYGALNARRENGWLKINFCPVQSIDEEITVKSEAVNYHKQVSLKPLQVFADSIRIADDDSLWNVSIGTRINFHNREYDDATLNRPVQSPVDFDWNSVYGLYLSGTSLIEQRKYSEAEEKIRACLQKDKNYAPALDALAELEYRKINYQASFDAAFRALSINTYDASANYYYGLAAWKLKKIADAKDGFDIASESAEYRVAAFGQLATIYFSEGNIAKAESYALKSLDYNKYYVDAWQLLAVIYRKSKKDSEYQGILEKIRTIDPLNRFAMFENYLLQKSESNKISFLSALRSEMPSESCLQLVCFYYRLGCIDEVKSLLELTPDGIESNVWKKYFAISPNAGAATSSYSAYPFREETADLLQQLIANENKWQWKYWLSLIFQSHSNPDRAKNLFVECGDQPTDPAFYVARANLFPQQAEASLRKAISLDSVQWRYHKLLAEFYLKQNQNADALSAIERFYKLHPENYIVGMLYAKTLLLNQRYKETDELLSRLNIIPFEGATEGRQLYREVKLMEAIDAMSSRKYKEAQRYISESKLWPENLGEGKPYDVDIDERLENWMSWLCYQRLHKAKEASISIQKILTYNLQTDNTLSVSYPANDLITAWAMEHEGPSGKARQWLEDRVRQRPGDPIRLWARDVVNKKQLAETPNDPTVRILQRLMKVSEE